MDFKTNTHPFVSAARVAAVGAVVRGGWVELMLAAADDEVVVIGAGEFIAAAARLRVEQGRTAEPVLVYATDLLNLLGSFGAEELLHVRLALGPRSGCHSLVVGPAGGRDYQTVPVHAPPMEEDAKEAVYRTLLDGVKADQGSSGRAVTAVSTNRLNEAQRHVERVHAWQSREKLAVEVLHGGFSPLFSIHRADLLAAVQVGIAGTTAHAKDGPHPWALLVGPGGYRAGVATPHWHLVREVVGPSVVADGAYDLSVRDDHVRTLNQFLQATDAVEVRAGRTSGGTHLSFDTGQATLLIPASDAPSLAPGVLGVLRRSGDYRFLTANAKWLAINHVLRPISRERRDETPLATLRLDAESRILTVAVAGPGSSLPIKREIPILDLIVRRGCAPLATFCYSVRSLSDMARRGGRRDRIQLDWDGPGTPLVAHYVASAVVTDYPSRRDSARGYDQRTTLVIPAPPPLASAPSANEEAHHE